MYNVSTVTADEVRLRSILSENGLTTKLGVKLNYKEYNLHAILCKAYDFTSGIAELEVPSHILSKTGESFAAMWEYKIVGRTSDKLVVRFKPTAAVVKTTIKTALAKDRNIFHTKINPVTLHPYWAKFISAPKADTKNTSVDWSKAEQHAKRVNEHTKQQILDGKTFNAHKDNPWARKHLKNKKDQ